MKHCDQDLDNVLDQSVPPFDLNMVAPFRTVLRKRAKQAGRLGLLL